MKSKSWVRIAIVVAVVLIVLLIVAAVVFAVAHWRATGLTRSFTMRRDLWSWRERLPELGQLPQGRIPFDLRSGRLGVFRVRRAFTPFLGIAGTVFCFGLLGLLIFGVVWFARTFTIVRRAAPPAIEGAPCGEEDSSRDDSSESEV